MPKILIAEDDPTMLALLGTLLEIEQYTVAYYDERESFIDVLNRENPQFLLLDIHLGTQNGLTLTKKIRNSEKFQNIKIILQSGMNLDSECRKVKADAFLLKPYMPETLLGLLKDLDV